MPTWRQWEEGRVPASQARAAASRPAGLSHSPLSLLCPDGSQGRRGVWRTWPRQGWQEQICQEWTWRLLFFPRWAQAGQQSPVVPVVTGPGQNIPPHRYPRRPQNQCLLWDRPVPSLLHSAIRQCCLSLNWVFSLHSPGGELQLHTRGLIGKFYLFILFIFLLCMGVASLLTPHSWCCSCPKHSPVLSAPHQAEGILGGI